MEIIDVWIRTRKPDGTYEGHYEKFNASEFDGAVFSGSPESPQITLKNGHVFDIYTRYDGDLDMVRKSIMAIRYSSKRSLMRTKRD